MTVLTACGPTHKTGRSAQDGFPSTSTGARGSEDDRPLNGSNSSLSKSQPGKNVRKIHPPLSNELLVQGCQPMNYSLTTPALYVTLYHKTLDTSLLKVSKHILSTLEKTKLFNVRCRVCKLRCQLCFFSAKFKFYN